VVTVHVAWLVEPVYSVGSLLLSVAPTDHIASD